MVLPSDFFKKKDENIIESCINDLNTRNTIESAIHLENVLKGKNNIGENCVLKAIYHLGLYYYQAKPPHQNFYKALRAFELVTREDQEGSWRSKIIEICRKDSVSQTEEGIKKILISYCLALSYYKDEKYEEATDNFEAYLSLLTQSQLEIKGQFQYTTIKALYYKGVSHTRLEQHREGIISFFSQLVQVDQGGYGKGNFRSLYNIGLMYGRLDEPANSLIYFSEALRHLNSYENKEKEAVMQWDTIDKFDKENLLFVSEERREFEESDTLSEIGLAHKRLGEFRKAKEIYKKVIRRYKDYVDNYLKTTNRKSQSERDEKVLLYFQTKNYLAMAYAETGEFEDALAEISFIEVLDKRYAEAYMIDTKGFIYYHMGRYDKALEYYNKAIKMDDKNEIYFYHKGNCYLKMKKFSEAISSYSDSILIKQNFLEAWNNRAVAYYENDKKDLAISDLKRVLQIDYKYISAHHNLLKINSNELSYRSFWHYWNDSTAKRIIAISLISLMFVTVMATIIYPRLSPTINSYMSSEDITNRLSSTTQETNISTTEENGSLTTITNVTHKGVPITEALQIELNIAIVGGIVTAILVLILLSPIIKSAKIGTTSAELTMIDREETKKTELQFFET